MILFCILVNFIVFIPIILLGITQDVFFFYISLFTFSFFPEIIFSWFGRYSFDGKKVHFSVFSIRIFSLTWQGIEDYDYGYFNFPKIWGNRSNYGLYFKTLEIKTKSGWVHVLPRANFVKIADQIYA